MIIATQRALTAFAILALMSKSLWAGSWTEWIEQDAPFISCVVDARNETIKNNLTPRALLLPLGQDTFLAYDVDLLRVAAVWTAKDQPLTRNNMAVNSYPYGGKKVSMGQATLPKPNGDIWFQNGIYPGASIGTPSFVDPRPAQPDKDEVGRGGLPRAMGRFVGINLKDGLEIVTEIAASTLIRERFSLGTNALVRRITVSPHRKPVGIVLAESGKTLHVECDLPGTITTTDKHLVLHIPASPSTQTLAVRFMRKGLKPTPTTVWPSTRWPQHISLPLPKENTGEALNSESIPLPKDNPYKRAVRPSAIDFFNDGRLALVTFDGDVWVANGLTPTSKTVSWNRFASGLHEPMGLKVLDDKIMVFDRNGLWRLHDDDSNGEADFHELFCSQIDQTADTREYASALEAEQDGRFIICKPGQNSKGRGSGSVLRISADGKTVTEIARGLRQPFMGLDPLSGQIALSDQQGHWVPSTPIIYVTDGAFYGHPNNTADRKRPITPPLTWIPHQACSSSSSIVWMRNSKMSALNDQAILLSYHPPKLFQIHTDIDPIVSQGGVTVLPVAIDAPILKGAINPADGLLYVAGFKIWGTKTSTMTFLSRVRPNAKKTWPVPTVARVEKRGILLSFATKLNADTASLTTSYTVRRWNYRRTSSYGSPNLNLNGQPGSETMVVSSVSLSTDAHSVFLGIPDMQEVMQLEVSYDITAKDSTPISNQTFLTAHLLRRFALTEHGFASDHVDLEANTTKTVSAPAHPTKEKGATLYTNLGCIACHSIDGSLEGKSGPSWLHLYGSTRKILGTGKSVLANDDYLRESILTPAAKVAEGAVTGEAGMPIYQGVLSEEQLDSLLLYIKSLKK